MPLHFNTQILPLLLFFVCFLNRPFDLLSFDFESEFGDFRWKHKCTHRVINEWKLNEKNERERKQSQKNAQRTYYTELSGSGHTDTRTDRCFVLQRTKLHFAR